KMLAYKGFTPESRVTFVNFAPEYVEKYAKDPNYKDYYDHGYPVLVVRPEAASTIDAKTFTVGELGGVPPATRYVQIDHVEGGPVTQDYTLHKLYAGLA